MSGAIPLKRPDPNALADLLEKAQQALGPGLNLGDVTKRLATMEATVRLANIKTTLILEKLGVDWKDDPRIKELMKK